MDNLACIVVVFAAYCLWAIAYCPTRCTTTETVSDFKSENPQPEPPDPKPVVIVEPLPVATFQMPKPAQTTANDLTTLSIRDLKKMASAAKIKRYSSMTKAQLITALTA